MIEMDEICPKCSGPAFEDWGWDGDDEYPYIYCPKCFEEEWKKEHANATEG